MTTDRAKIVERLRGYNPCLSPGVAICDRHAVDEAADLIEQDSKRIAALEVKLGNTQDAMLGPLAWLETWARHIGDCNGNEYCTCGLTFMRHELRTFSRRDYEEVDGEE